MVKINIFTLKAFKLVLIYLLSITLMSYLNIIYYFNYNNFYFKKNNIVNFFITNTKSNFIRIKTVDTSSYIKNKGILDRQINNNNLQEFVDDAKGSILKLNNFFDKKNNKIYSYDAYGNIISSSSSFRAGDSLHDNFSSNHTRLSCSLSSQTMMKNENHAIYFLYSAQKRNSLCDTSLSSLQKAIGLQDENFLSLIPNSLRYNGERFDSNVNLQYLRARFYNPESKRFINQDSYNLLNKFSYTNANPIMQSDPTGNNVLNDIKNRFGVCIDWFKNANCDPNWEKIAGVAGGFFGSLSVVLFCLVYYKFKKTNFINNIKQQLSNDSVSQNQMIANLFPDVISNLRIFSNNKQTAVKKLSLQQFLQNKLFVENSEICEYNFVLILGSFNDTEKFSILYKRERVVINSEEVQMGKPEEFTNTFNPQIFEKKQDQNVEIEDTDHMASIAAAHSALQIFSLSGDKIFHRNSGLKTVSPKYIALIWGSTDDSF